MYILPTGTILHFARLVRQRRTKAVQVGISSCITFPVHRHSLLPYGVAGDHPTRLEQFGGEFDRTQISSCFRWRCAECPGRDEIDVNAMP